MRMVACNPSQRGLRQRRSRGRTRRRGRRRWSTRVTREVTRRRMSMSRLSTPSHWLLCPACLSCLQRLPAHSSTATSAQVEKACRSAEPTRGDAVELRGARPQKREMMCSKSEKTERRRARTGGRPNSYRPTRCTYGIGYSLSVSPYASRGYGLRGATPRPRDPPVAVRSYIILYAQFIGGVARYRCVWRVVRSGPGPVAH